MELTAVEWLIEKLKESGFKHLDLAANIIDQAKEMEKEQIIDAATWGTLYQSTEQYYNDTFNKI